MKRNEVAALARKLMNQHGLEQVPFQFNRRKNALGVCKFRYGRVASIELSETFLPFITKDEIRDTILHEIAHALAGRDANHGPAWKRKAREIGANPNRLHEMDPEVLKRYQQQTSKYRATCGTGKCVVHFNRMGKVWQRGGYRCGKHGKRFSIEQLN